jgi:type II secretory pathway pseudopilin PulG
MTTLTTPPASAKALGLPRLAAALATIVLLALVLPYGAVRTLHQRRLATADRNLQAIADALKVRLADNPASIPSGTQILAGWGTRPTVTDDRWNTAVAFPLSRVLPAGDPADIEIDPWGNAYLIELSGAGPGLGIRVISAGPDGILQTPFVTPTHAPSGDDRQVSVR